MITIQITYEQYEDTSAKIVLKILGREDTVNVEKKVALAMLNIFTDLGESTGLSVKIEGNV